MSRTGLAGWNAMVTTAAGIHAQPLAEWAITGLLYFVKDLPDLQARQSAHRWERMAIGRWSGAGRWSSVWVMSAAGGRGAE